MAQDSGTEQKTAYGVFVQACWAQHKRLYPDELIRKEIEEFNEQCSKWWYNLSEQERERFQEMADSGYGATLPNAPFTTQISTRLKIEDEYEVNNDGVVSPINSNNRPTQSTISSLTAASGISSFGPSFIKREYGIQGASGQGQKTNQKLMKDPNAPKKPLSAYFLFNKEERIKVKAEFPDYSIIEMAKEIGRRWAYIDPVIKQSYEQRYQESRRQYEQDMQEYQPSRRKIKDPNAPKQPLSAYFIFQNEIRLKIKNEHPSYTIYDVSKEVGRRWADMAPEVKQPYKQMAEENRRKYDIEMAAYLRGKSQKMSVENRQKYDHEIAYPKGNNATKGGTAATTSTSSSAMTPAIDTTAVGVKREIFKEEE